MAWKDARVQKGTISKARDGCFPMHAGEFCGNHRVGSQALCLYCQTQQEADEALARYLAQMRFGIPHPCEAYPTVELAQKAGLVGLYLKESVPPLFDWEASCDTPPELMEPGREAEYNRNGPGLLII